MPNERIGVYICHCGGNISDYVDVESVKSSGKDIPGVEITKTMMFACSDSSQQEIIADIRERNLDAIVVASCSPKLHQHTFREVASRAGLNPYKYVQANLREQVSWAHSDDLRGATSKAIMVVRGAVSRAKHSQDLHPIEVQSIPSVLIVGAGISGLRAALAFSSLDISVYLIEKSPFVGGRVAQWNRLFPDQADGKRLVRDLVSDIRKRENITIFTGAQITEKSGCIGNLTVKVRITPRYVSKDCDHFAEAIEQCPVEVPDDFTFGVSKRKAIYMPYNQAYPPYPTIDQGSCTECGICSDLCGDSINLKQREQTTTLNVGAILVTTGFDPYVPSQGEFGYGTSNKVVTLPELEQLVAPSNVDGDLIIHGIRIRSIAFIYCVGSRQHKQEGAHTNEYCSRYCCTSATFTSLELARRYPSLKMYHLYRDIRTYGKNELFYEAASRNGIVYLKYDESEPPRVVSRDNEMHVFVRDLLTEKEELDIPADLVVLVTGMTPRKDDSLSGALKIPAGRDGFFNEIHPKLKPVETIIGGIYIAGAGQGPKNVQESITSSLSAVAKASSLLMKGVIELEPNVAKVDEDACTWCGRCSEACPYEAISKRDQNGKEIAIVNGGICKGCGGCIPVCPYDAIQVRGYTDEEILGTINSIFANGDAL